MPIYTIVNKKTKRPNKQTRKMTISEMEEFEKKNPHLEIVPGAPMICYHYTSMHPSDAFRDRLKEIKKSHPGNTINIR